MGRSTPRLLALGCWLLLCGSTAGQAFNSADSVRNLYRKYLNREPTPNELTQWVWSFQKGLSLHDAQVTFLSSDEYFSRFARSSNSFIAGLFTDILGRPPTTQESLQWLHRLNVSQSDRGKLVRDFLKAAQGHVAGSTPPARPAPVQPENQLVATANLLHDAIEEELGGTTQGRQLSLMSRNLVNASRSLEKAKQISSSIYHQALTDVQEALTAVEQQMRQLYFAAQDSNIYLERFKQLFAAMGGAATTVATLPLSRPPAPDSVGSDLHTQYTQLSSGLLSDTNQVLLLLRNSAVQDMVSSQLTRDIEFFQSQATAVHQTVRVGMMQQDLRHEVLRLRALSQGVTQVMQGSGQVGRVAQRWEIVTEDVRQLGELMGISAGPAIDPGQPVMLNLPTYHRLPYQVQRPTVAQLSSKAIPVTDQAIAHIDAFVAGFNRFLPQSPRVPALQAQTRQLRVLIGQFRQELANGTASPQLKASLAQINQSLQVVSSLWTRTVQERQLTNTPDLTGISGAIQSLNQIFQGA